MVTRMWAVVDASQERPPRGATLLRSASLVTPGDERWEAGIRWQPEACGDAEIVQAAGHCGAGFAGWPDPAAVPDQAEYVAPYVAVGQECPTLGTGDDLEPLRARTRRLLERCETVGIARELWRGDIARAETPDLPNDYLTKAATLDELNGSASTPAIDAFAWLEDALATCGCGGVGMIHASPFTATVWRHLSLIEPTPDGRLVSALGTLVVADPGNDGSAPDLTVDATKATAWAYGTTMVDVRRGAILDVGDRSTMNRGTNQFTVWAARPFAATFDPCCHVGIKVNHAVRS